MCFSFNWTLFIVRTNLCATFQTYTTFITITMTINIRSLFLSAYNLFASHTFSLFFSYDYSLFCSQPFCKQCTYSLDHHSGDLQKRIFTQDWLSFNWPLPALFGPFVYARLQSAERSQCKRFMISPSRELYRERLCICVLRLVWPACLLLLVYLKGVRYICIHTNFWRGCRYFAFYILPCKLKALISCSRSRFNCCFHF